VAAVIGRPVRHSLSPTLHNAAFAAVGLDWVYVAFEVGAGEGAAAVAAEIPDRRGVRISEPKACGRYLGRVIRGIDPAGRTPGWMVRRLERAGLRAISPLVDITNFITFDLNRPLHVFDAGRLMAQSDEARAREQELILAYRGAAITAFSEVETSLGAIAHLADQETYQIEQVAQSQQAFDIAQVRYREGIADFLSVLDAQRTLYQARDQLGQLKLSRLQAIVTLYKALGGGWTDPAPSNFAQQ